MVVDLKKSSPSSEAYVDLSKLSFTETIQAWWKAQKGEQTDQAQDKNVTVEGEKDPVEELRSDVNALKVVNGTLFLERSVFIAMGVKAALYYAAKGKEIEREKEMKKIGKFF